MCKDEPSETAAAPIYDQAYLEFIELLDSEEYSDYEKEVFYLSPEDFQIGQQSLEELEKKQGQEFDSLVANSFTRKEVALLLDLDESAIEDRIVTVKTIYGFKKDDDWLIPKFQFVSPGISKVIPYIQSHWDPVSVAAFFSTPSPDLEDSDENQNPLSPSDWLRMGRDAQAVIDLLEET